MIWFDLLVAGKSFVKVGVLPLTLSFVIVWELPPWILKKRDCFLQGLCQRPEMNPPILMLILNMNEGKRLSSISMKNTEEIELALSQPLPNCIERELFVI